MSETLKELRELPLEELVRRHDAIAQTTSVGVAYYLQEIARRDAVQQTEAILRLTATMVRLTKFIAALTALIFVLTVVNVVAIVLSRP